VRGITLRLLRIRRKKMANQPTKESVRKWLRQRQARREPPPDIAEIRRELRWGTDDNVNHDIRPVVSATPCSSLPDDKRTVDGYD
jgi:hypothetical protein